MIVVPFEWVQDEPISVGVTSSTGIQTTEAIAAAVGDPEASGRSFLGYGLIGLLVGVILVALGLLWLPSLRRAAPVARCVHGADRRPALLLAIEALSEALELQAVLPGALGGPGLVLLGASFSYLALIFLSRRLSGGEGGSAVGATRLALATRRGGHRSPQPGRGLAIGSSFAVGELALGTFLIVGFIVHNVTGGPRYRHSDCRGRPAAEPRPAGRARARGGRAGDPRRLDRRLRHGRRLAAPFFAAAAGAALEVVTEVGRYVARKAPGGIVALRAGRVLRRHRDHVRHRAVRRIASASRVRSTGR